MSEGVARFTISVPPELLSHFDDVCATRGYASRSEAVRDSMRLFLLSREWDAQDDQETLAVLAMIRTRGAGVEPSVPGAFTVSTMTVPSADGSSLEIRALRGSLRAVRELADAVFSDPSVRFGRVVSLTAPKDVK
jgi:CopG family nickel-responsive transcriptional regulator